MQASGQRAWASAMAVLLPFFGGCSESAGPAIPAHEFRLSFSGTQSGSTDIIGPPVVPGDATRDYVVLGSGIDNGIPTPYQVYANRATSMVASSGRDQVILYFNPNVTHTGQYAAGACPEPAAVSGCFDLYLAFGLPAAGGTPASQLRQVGNTVILTVEVFTPSRIRARFSGQFTFTPSGGPAVTVTVSDGFVDAIRPPGH